MAIKGSLNLWSRQESNLDLLFRKQLFYPLNYGTATKNFCRAAKIVDSCFIAIFLLSSQGYFCIFKPSTKFMKIIQLATSCLLLVCTCCINSSAQSNTTKPKVTIDHVAIFVVDLRKEQSFYRDVLQVDTIAEPFHDNKHAWFSIGNGIALHLIQGAPQPKEYYKNHHLCFSVGSLTDFTKRLLDLQLSFEDVAGKINAITTRVDGVHQIWMKDPEGYWIEVNDAKH